ncbi:AMP-binding protein, partial [Mucilaginibacter angelicae]
NPEVRLYNLYGPSETHVVTGTSYSYQDGVLPLKASIGKPVDNTVIYILDSNMRLVPPGVEGEIYIGGWNLAKGYLGNAGQTKEKFIPDPFRPGSLVYRSGDIGKWHSNGEIEYIMRRDNQLKINGYRVELGEIESCLREHPQVEEAIVTAKVSGEGNYELVGYIVSKEAIMLTELRSYLSRHVPGYMVPGHYVQLEYLPLTSNGKVDKSSLPLPDGFGLLR